MGTDRHRIIEEIRHRLRVLSPAKVILSGSQVEGKVDVDSDIDLIVVLDKETSAVSFKEKMLETITVRKLLVEINRQIALDVLVYSKPEWQSLLDSRSSFSKEIIEKGITLQ